MRNIYIITLLALLPQLVNAQEEVKNSYAIKLEVLKPLSWMATGGYVLEPEFSLFHDRWAFNFAVGLSDVNAEEIYKQLDYNNKGWHGQAGVEYQAVPFEEEEGKIPGLYFGINANMAKYTETGSLVFEGNYFEDYEAVLIQDNTTWGVNWLMSTKIALGNRVFTDFTVRLSKLISENNHPYYPVYYVPGMGIMNMSENKKNGHTTALGLSVKFGILL